MSSDVQRLIALAVLERGWSERERVLDTLLDIGRRLERGESIEATIWMQRVGLTQAQFDDILEDLGLEYESDVTESGEHVRAAPQTDEIDFSSSSETPIISRPPLDDEGESSSPETVSDDEAEYRHAGSRHRDTTRNLNPLSKFDDAFDDDVSEALEQTSEHASDELDSEDYDTTADTLTSSPGDTMPPELPAKRRPDEKLEGRGDEAPDELDDDPSEADLTPASMRNTPKTGYDQSQIFEAAEHDESLEPGERFVLDEELGSGGSGRVVRAFDRLLGRTVAMKILRRNNFSEDESLSRFIAEAQATGQLEHPNIVPIYDFGVLPNGDVFYTMREVEGHSLRRLLERIQTQEAVRREYTLVRLLNILRQVSQAVHYAHVRSVIHRDLKPENIMLGDYGEVLVMDWGLAHVLNQDVTTLHDSEEESTGQTLGTPSYMPPEQARGNLSEIDERSDIYSLGAILYELLTLEPPYTGDDPVDIMWDVVDSDLPPPSERAPAGREVPEELEQICVKAMREDYDRRYDSARQFSEALEGWLEGLQPREAERRIEQAREAADRYHDLLERVEHYDEELRELRDKIGNWEPVENKRQFWGLEDKRDDLEVESTREFCRAVTHFTQALAHNPDDVRAREGLADLYWSRFRRAEMRGDLVNTIYFKTLVEHYDTGTYASLLEGRTDLRILTQPAEAHVELVRYEERDRRLIPENADAIGHTPLELSDVPLGSYLLEMNHSDREPVTRPIFIERDRDTHVHVRLPETREVADGFVYVPSGRYISGGDPDAFEPRPPERIFVNAFFCARFPVTFGEYLEWFNELYEREGESAMERAPQTRESEGLLIEYDDDLERWVPSDILIEGHARQRYPTGEGHEARLPVIGVRAEDARAYCRWRRERDGYPYRLPTTEELEKAGRGVDGRYFPWGDHFDANFCKMRSSRPEKPPQPEPVGIFEDDVSPYGVRDLAGGVQEWCHHDNPDNALHQPVMGGGWNLDERPCHLAGSTDVLAAARTAKVGFRLVYGALGEGEQPT